MIFFATFAILLKALVLIVKKTEARLLKYSATVVTQQPSGRISNSQQLRVEQLIIMYVWFERERERTIEGLGARE